MSKCWCDKYLVVSVLSVIVSTIAFSSQFAQIETDVEDWHGYQQHRFQYLERDCFVIEPNTPLPSHPWIWRARFPGYHDEVDVLLVEKGFHVAFINTGGMFGSPEAMDIWDAYYTLLTLRGGLSPLVALEGVSRGGLFVYNWAARHPDKVTCIYADTPVLDFKSWPLGQGTGRPSPGDWKTLLQQYGLTEPEALAYHGIPLDNLEPLARAGIPLLHMVGLNDRIVPPAENTFVLEKRYRQWGGTVTVLPNQQGDETLHGHHFPLDDPPRYAQFILENTPLPPLGFEWFSLRGGLNNSFHRFATEKQGRVAFLGGSITHNPGWQWMTARMLQARFPETVFEFINAGIPSTGSTPGAFRLENDVLSKGRIDLLFEEAAVNDLHNGRTPLEQMRGMEGIVRHARQSNPVMDIVLLHFVDPHHTADYQQGIIPTIIRNHETVARHYQVPSINLAREVHDRMQAGQFDWARDFVNLHPSPFGQRLYYWSIKRLLDRAWSESVGRETEIKAYPMPKPLDTQSYAGGKFVDIKEAKVLGGFTLDPQCHPDNSGSFRTGFVDVPMLVGEVPGDSFEFGFSGKGVGLFVAAGPDAGTIEYRIDEGPLQTLDTFTKWSRGLNIPWAYILDVDLSPGHHTLTVTIASQTNSKSKGHALRIRNLLVNE